MGSSKNAGKRDLVIKHEDWKKMIHDLLSQVQAKEAQLRETEGRVEGAEERAQQSDKSLLMSKAAYDTLNDELLSAYPFLITLQYYPLT